VTETVPRESDVVRNILNAALEIIATKNISRTHLRAIAAKAGISQGTLHYHFPSKEGLYQAVVEDMSRIFAEQRRRFLADPELQPKEQLGIFFAQMKEVILEKTLLLAFYDFWVEATRETDESGIRTMIQRNHHGWRGDIEKVVHDGVRKGAFCSEHAELVPHLMVSLMDGAALQYLVDGEAMDLDAYFEEANAVILGLLEI
jgi:AcrR family transcriptional regulator